jgi:hypothetical protein
MMICQMHVYIDFAEMLFSGRLCRRTRLVTCLEIARSGGIRSCAPIFFLTVWFQRERGEALLSVATVGHVLRSMVKLEAENDMEAEFPMTSNRDSSLCDDEELAW